MALENLSVCAGPWPGHAMEEFAVFTSMVTFWGLQGMTWTALFLVEGNIGGYFFLSVTVSLV